MKSAFVKNFFNAVLAGIMIGIGGTVYLSVCNENKLVGAVLFCFGLFMIVCLKFGLYTGKVGYIPLKKPAYILEVLTALLGNFVGVFITALGIGSTRLNVFSTAYTAMEPKINDSLLSSFILAIFCGMLMFLAVESNRIYTEKQNYIGAVVGVFMPVIVFIMCGFNHCIADMYYISVVIVKNGFSYLPIGYLLIVILGNAVGGMIIPLVQRFILKVENV